MAGHGRGRSLPKSSANDVELLTSYLVYVIRNGYGDIQCSSNLDRRMKLDPQEGETRRIVAKKLIEDVDSKHDFTNEYFIRYSLPQALSNVFRAAVCIHDPYKAWQLIENPVQTQLKDFKFKWNNRLLEYLELDFIPDADKRNEYTQTNYLHGYKFPHLYLYIVKCDDMDAYKTNVKLRLQAWVDKLKATMKKGNVEFEWFIVYVPKKESPRNSSILKKPNSKLVYEKLRSDFNRKDERCCKIALFDRDVISAPSLSRVEARATKMSDFLEMLCEKLTMACEKRFLRLETEIKAKESLKYSKGWSFYNFFILKESLAFCWMQLGQFSEALAIYDSLAQLYVDLSQSRAFKFCLPKQLKEHHHFSSTQEQQTSSSVEQLPIEGRKVFDLSESVRTEGESIESRGLQNRADVTPGRISLIGNGICTKEQLSLALSYGRNVFNYTLPQHWEIPTDKSEVDNTFHNVNSNPYRRIFSETYPLDKLVTNLGGNTQIPPWFLDISKETFREKIFIGNISKLDLEMYMFSRQALLCFAMQAPHRSLRRGIQLISSVSSELENGSPDIKDNGNDKTLSGVERAIIAKAWAFSASVELVCAANASITNLMRNPSSEGAKKSYSYSNILLTEAQRYLEELARIYWENSDMMEMNSFETFDRCFLNKNLWLLRVPKILHGFGRQRTSRYIEKCEVDEGLLLNWLAPGLLSSMKSTNTFFRLYDLLFICRSEHCVAAGRIRMALLLSFKRAVIHAGLGYFDEAITILNKILHSPELTKYKLWPDLAFEAQVLYFKCAEKLGDVHAKLITCLDLLLMNSPDDSKREIFNAFRELCLNKHFSSPVRLPLRRYPLISVYMTPEKPEADYAFVGQVGNVQLRLISTFPADCHFSEIKIMLQTTQDGKPISLNARNRENSENLSDMHIPTENTENIDNSYVSDSDLDSFSAEGDAFDVISPKSDIKEAQSDSEYEYKTKGISFKRTRATTTDGANFHNISSELKASMDKNGTAEVDSKASMTNTNDTKTSLKDLQEEQLPDLEMPQSEMDNPSYETLVMTAEAPILHEGMNTITFKSKSSAKLVGLYSLERVNFTIGMLQLEERAETLFCPFRVCEAPDNLEIKPLNGLVTCNNSNFTKSQHLSILLSYSGYATDMKLNDSTLRFDFQHLRPLVKVQSYSVKKISAKNDVAEFNKKGSLSQDCAASMINIPSIEEKEKIVVQFELNCLYEESKLFTHSIEYQFPLNFELYLKYEDRKTSAKLAPIKMVKTVPISCSTAFESDLEVFSHEGRCFVCIVLSVLIGDIEINSISIKCLDTRQVELRLVGEEPRMVLKNSKFSLLYEVIGAFPGKYLYSLEISYLQAWGDSVPFLPRQELVCNLNNAVAFEIERKQVFIAKPQVLGVAEVGIPVIVRYCVEAREDAINITRLTDKSKKAKKAESSIHFKFERDQNVWLLLGKTEGTLEIKNKGTVVFEIRALPLKIGSFSPPKIILDDYEVQNESEAVKVISESSYS